ncbi:hypothetical protein GCM10009639_32060 [Kitasatospora putterlickiae]|uniref:Uncharacterized protein n=1 Tax=Kitasatospora putterlickiae TaxID=221725 RepID=A0ABP4IQH8_9ACTN
MARYLTVTAAVTIDTARLRTYLRSPVRPASARPESDWTGLCAPWRDAAVRRRYRTELPAALAECDRWLDGDHAALLHGLDEDGELTLRHDEATGSLTIDFDTRVDFELPGMIWALTALRGLSDAMADDDTGLVELTTDWTDETVLLRLTPHHSALLHPAHDPATLTRARDAAFDTRCLASGADEDEPTGEVLARLAGPTAGR